MTAALLDVNVLVALLWPAHEGHERAQNWFAKNAGAGWATCPMTQAGFVRIVSNPAFSRDAVTPKEAMLLLAGNMRHRSHQFWADEIDVVEAMIPFAERMKGHQQVTDGYLLGLAQRKKGKLATMDRGVADLCAEKSVERNLVVVI